MYKPVIVAESNIPIKILVIRDFEKRRKSIKRSQSLIPDSKTLAFGCSKISSLPIGVEVEGDNYLNGLALLVECSSDNVVLTIEVFDFSRPTNPAMTVMASDNLGYINFNGGSLTSTYIESRDRRKFHIYEWIGDKKSITVSVIGEALTSPDRMKRISFDLIERFSK